MGEKTLDNSTLDTSVKKLVNFNDLSGLENGNFPFEFEEEMEKLLNAVKSIEKPGIMTIKLTVTPIKGVNRAVTIKPTLDAKPPKRERFGIVRYITKNNSLSTIDPGRQLDFSGPGFAETKKTNLI